MPETDLDRAFTALTDDVATRAGRPGAASAIRTARRRRRTTLAAVVATAAIAVGSAVALPQLTDARPGWTQDRVGDPALEGEGQESLDLPDVDHARLESALRGWRAAGPQDATSESPVPCLPLNETSANVSTASTSQTGLYSAIEGYRNGGVAADEVRLRLEGLRRCQSVRMVERSLGGGVTLVVWDRGGQAGHGAVWLAAGEDRAVLVAADGRGTSVPLTAAREVAELVREVLASGSGSG